MSTSSSADDLALITKSVEEAFIQLYALQTIRTKTGLKVIFNETDMKDITGHTETGPQGFLKNREI